MADNFLEKHNDDYQARKAAWQKNRQLLKIKKRLAQKKSDKDEKDDEGQKSL